MDTLSPVFEDVLVLTVFPPPLGPVWLDGLAIYFFFFKKPFNSIFYNRACMILEELKAKFSGRKMTKYVPILLPLKYFLVKS